jgi:antirestriction protein
MNDTPRIYVACLSSYNAGFLHGVWIDCDSDTSEILDQVRAMLAASPMPDAEEWAIHDYEGFHGISIHEYESFDRIVELAEKIEEHGEAVAAFIERYGWDEIDEFEEKYRGCYKHATDFAYEQMKDSGLLKTIVDAGLNEFYIDFERMGHDLTISDYTGIKRGYHEFYVFDNH